jgi:hypothetical protein
VPIVSINGVNWYIYITATEFVSFEVWTEFCKYFISSIPFAWICRQLCNFVVRGDQCMWTSLNAVLKRILRYKTDSLLLLYWRDGGVILCLFLKVKNVRKWVRLRTCYREIYLGIRQRKRDDQCTYKRNTEARSRNHCYRGKAINISTYMF